MKLLPSALRAILVTTLLALGVRAAPADSPELVQARAELTRMFERGSTDTNEQVKQQRAEIARLQYLADVDAKAAGNDSAARLISVNFPGGSAAALLAAADKSSLSGFNVIGEKADLAIELPPFAVRNADAWALATALNEILRPRGYGPAIFRQLLAATRGDHDLASEALQQTYLRIARNARPCESAPMFAGWLSVVARSALHDCWRRRRSFWELLTRRHADPSEAATAAEEEDRLLPALDRALTQIDPDDRALLEAKYFRGIAVRSLASELAVSEKAVESRLTRARAELRRQLLTALTQHE